MARILNVIAIIAVVTAAAPGWSGQDTNDTAPTEPGIVGEWLDSIPLRNNSGSELYFFLSGGRGWQRLMLKPGTEADLPWKEAIVAVPTSDTANAAPQAPTSLPDEVFRADFVYRRPHFYRQLKSGARWELCWSQQQKYWLVQRLGEQLCP